MTGPEPNNETFAHRTEMSAFVNQFRAKPGIFSNNLWTRRRTKHQSHFEGLTGQKVHACDRRSHQGRISLDASDVGASNFELS